MKKLEVLFPDFCHLYAEGWNADYLAKCSPEIEVIETLNHEVPAFVRGDVDMVYLGAASETKQELILERLRPYKARIEELIERGTVFLVTGNAPEIFGTEIRDGGRVIPALGLFPFHAVRNPGLSRHNSQFIGEFEGMTVLGHKSQFSFAYPDEEGASDIEPAFIRLEQGTGMNPGSMLEGVRRNNFFATYSLGPFLILNPDFDKYLLRLLGLPDSLAHEDEIYDAYRYRLTELRRALQG